MPGAQSKEQTAQEAWQDLLRATDKGVYRIWRPGCGCPGNQLTIRDHCYNAQASISRPDRAMAQDHLRRATSCAKEAGLWYLPPRDLHSPGERTDIAVFIESTMAVLESFRPVTTLDEDQKPPKPIAKISMEGEPAILVRIPLSYLPRALESAAVASSVMGEVELKDAEALARELCNLMNKVAPDGVTPIGRLLDELLEEISDVMDVGEERHGIQLLPPREG